MKARCVRPPAGAGGGPCVIGGRPPGLPRPPQTRRAPSGPVFWSCFLIFASLLRMSERVRVACAGARPCLSYGSYCACRHPTYSYCLGTEPGSWRVSCFPFSDLLDAAHASACSVRHLVLVCVTLRRLALIIILTIIILTRAIL